MNSYVSRGAGLQAALDKLLQPASPKYGMLIGLQWIEVARVVMGG